MSLIQTITGPREGEIFTAKTFLAYMRKSSDHWWNDTKSNTQCPWVFRGHWDANWQLKPTAGRDSLEGIETFKKLVEKIKEDATVSSRWQTFPENSKEIIARQWAQYISFKGFLDLADELGFGINMHDDILYNKLHQYENFDKFLSTQSPSHHHYPSIKSVHPSGYRGFNRTALALAQHHGVPTFLLDWTENPLAACHFATTKPDHIEAKNGLAIWALNTLPLPLHSDEIGLDTRHGILITNTFKSQNEFLSKQSGVFLEMTDYEDVWMRTGAYPALEDVLSSFERENAINTIESYIKKVSKLGVTSHGLKERYLDRFPEDFSILKKVILGAEHQEDLSKLLSKEGITKAHMMPNLDNIASTAMTSLIRQ